MNNNSERSEIPRQSSARRKEKDRQRNGVPVSTVAGVKRQFNQNIGVDTASTSTPVTTVLHPQKRGEDKPRNNYPCRTTDSQYLISSRAGHTHLHRQGTQKSFLADGSRQAQAQTGELCKMVLHTHPNFVVKKPESQSKIGASGAHSQTGSGKKVTATLDEAQTMKIKKILAECLQNLEQNAQMHKQRKISPREENVYKTPCDPPSYRRGECQCQAKKSSKVEKNVAQSGQPLTQASLLRSYLSGSNPTREEYVSKKRNVSNSLISSDSVHHSIFLVSEWLIMSDPFDEDPEGSFFINNESGRERRQCLLQYLTNVVAEGQVVIYANSIPAVESLMNFLTKHGFRANLIHPNMLMAESNSILSEFTLNKFSVLLCAEDHYHSCPAHFRGVKTIINYELPVSSPVENWTIRNGIVEFSDNLPVHIYTFIKKSCPLDGELVKLLQLDGSEEPVEELLPQALTEQVMTR